MPIQTNVRELANGKWVCDIRGPGFFDSTWKAARITKTHTVHTARELKNYDGVMSISREAPASVHYPLCFHETKEEAEQVQRDVRAFYGEGKA